MIAVITSAGDGTEDGGWDSSTVRTEVDSVGAGMRAYSWVIQARVSLVPAPPDAREEAGWSR